MKETMIHIVMVEYLLGRNLSRLYLRFPFITAQESYRDKMIDVTRRAMTGGVFIAKD